jgi:hypothetical protein
MSNEASNFEFDLKHLEQVERTLFTVERMALPTTSTVAKKPRPNASEKNHTSITNTRPLFTVERMALPTT